MRAVRGSYDESRTRPCRVVCHQELTGTWKNEHDLSSKMQGLVGIVHVGGDSASPIAVGRLPLTSVTFARSSQIARSRRMAPIIENYNDPDMWFTGYNGVRSALSAL